MDIENLYKDKKVCILCCGESIDKHKIDFDKYDFVIGLNRLYKTKYIDKINVLYDSCHYIHDFISLEKIKILNESNIKYYFLIPGKISKQKIIDNMKLIQSNLKIPFKVIDERDKHAIGDRKILAGVFVLKKVLGEKPKSIDLYGYDFYSSKYVEGITYKHAKEQINYMHDLKLEKLYFLKIIKNPEVEINYFQ